MRCHVLWNPEVQFHFVQYVVWACNSRRLSNLESALGRQPTRRSASVSHHRVAWRPDVLRFFRHLMGATSLVLAMGASSYVSKDTYGEQEPPPPHRLSTDSAGEPSSDVRLRRRASRDYPRTTAWVLLLQSRAIQKMIWSSSCFLKWAQWNRGAFWSSAVVSGYTSNMLTASQWGET